MDKNEAKKIVKSMAECVKEEEWGDAVHITEYVSSDELEMLLDFIEKNC